MLLINKQLLRLAKHSWGWIIAIVVTKLVILLSFMLVVSAVARLIASLWDGGMKVSSAPWMNRIGIWLPARLSIGRLWP